MESCKFRNHAVGPKTYRMRHPVFVTHTEYVIPSNPLVIPRRRGGPDFSNFQNYLFIARAPSRIRTNPETRVDLIRLRKNLELELKPNSFEK